MNPDPRFPNRPTHPDFALLSEEVCANDNLSELGGEMFEAVVTNFVDLDSLAYMVTQRAGLYLRLRGMEPTAEAVATIASAMIDGFVLGAGFERRKQAANERE